MASPRPQKDIFRIGVCEEWLQITESSSLSDDWRLLRGQLAHWNRGLHFFRRGSQKAQGTEGKDGENGQGRGEVCGLRKMMKMPG